MVIHGMDLVMGMVLDGEEASEEDGEEVGEGEPAVGPGLIHTSTEQILISTGIIPTPTEELTGIPFSNPLKRRRKNEGYDSPSGPFP